MSTQIKNTLFRFITTRAPKAVSKGIATKNFIYHPEVDEDGNRLPDSPESPFLQKAVDDDPLSVKPRLLADACSAYAPDALTRISQLHDIHPTVYDFGVWLSANRKRFTDLEIKTKIELLSTAGLPGTERITPTVRKRLWDDLFYQILTSKSGYIRDGILSLLVADFFLQNFDTSNPLKEIRKLASARIVIPKEFVDYTVLNGEVQTNIDFKRLQQEADAELSKERIEQLNAMVRQFENLNAIHAKETRTAYKAAKKDYDAEVKTAYANAEFILTDHTDPVTQISQKRKEYTEVILPEFEFGPIEQFHNEPYRSFLSERALKFMDQAEEMGAEVFDDVIKQLKEEITAETEKLFQKTELSRVAVNNEGFMATTNYVTEDRSFILTGSESTAGSDVHTSLVLKFKNVGGVGNPSTPYFSLVYNGGTATGTTAELEREGDIIKMTIPLLNYDVDKNTVSFQISGTFKSATNTEISFKGSGKRFSIGPERTFVYNGKGTYDRELLEVEEPGDFSGNPTTVPTPVNYGIQRLGVADYRRVEQEVCCYVPGEVSHIENIMAKEYKEKSTRRLRRQENTLTSTREKENEKLSDTTSTDRFEMNQEISSVLAQQNSFTAGSTISWNGHIDGSASADFANSNSSEHSDMQALSHAKEVTERALERVVEKVKEERVTKIIEEYEENNKHGYDNRKGDNHISGVYRWVDKIYKNKIVNYGKRLMYEFMVPEPAAFHNMAMATKAETPTEQIVEKPADPRTAPNGLALKLGATFDSVYERWVQLYNAEVTEPHPEIMWSGKAITYGSEKAEYFVEIPEGYFLKNAHITEMHRGGGEDGNAGYAIGPNGDFSNLTYFQWSHNYGNKLYKGKVPVSAFFRDAEAGLVHFDLEFQRSASLHKQWQLETFNAIISAYEDKLAEYNDKTTAIKQEQAEKAKTNPLYFRQIEHTMLRKNCIAYMAKHSEMGRQSLLTGTNLNSLQVLNNDQYLNDYALKVKFFEQAFEWDLMSYQFYPFYWAEKSKWEKLYTVESYDDALFRAFLQSGMARVILTVRPGFEDTVSWFMATGQIWNGGEAVTFDDPMYLSIVDELTQPESEVEETWESRVPTSLTVIQAGSIGLDVEGLPCDPDCKDYKLLDEEGDVVLDGEGNPVSTNPIKQQPADTQLGNVIEELNGIYEILDGMQIDVNSIQDDIEDIKDTLNP